MLEKEKEMDGWMDGWMDGRTADGGWWMVDRG